MKIINDIHIFNIRKIGGGFYFQDIEIGGIVGDDLVDDANHQVGRKEGRYLGGEDGITLVHFGAFGDIPHGNEERTQSIPVDGSRLTAVLKLGDYFKLPVEHAHDRGKVLADIDDRADNTLGAGDTHIGPDALGESPMDGEVIRLGADGIVDDFRFQYFVLDDRLTRVNPDGIQDKPAAGIGSLIVLFQLLAKNKVFADQGLIGLLQLEVVFDAVVSFVDAAGYLGADVEKGSLVEFIVAKKERKGYYLQHQEEEKVKMPSDEEKNVTHLI